MKGNTMRTSLATSLHTQDTGSFRETLVGKGAMIAAATGFVAICAHIAVPLPFTLVPLTLQTFAVILVGMMLGPIAGFSAMALYLVDGAMGLPVFSPYGLGGLLQLHGPVGGYLLSYPFAAALAGWVVRMLRGRSSQMTAGIIAGLVASLLVYAIGASWMASQLHLSAASAWHMGIAPFLPGDVVKIIAAAGMFKTLSRWQLS
jgi:biotin transport system substrate-specific component